MALGPDDFERASRGEPIEVPVAMYCPLAEHGIDWPDDPTLRRCVEWLKGFMTSAEWHRRRDAALVRLHCAALGLSIDGGKGRFYDDTDAFAWYLFQAEAFLDHPWNYEPMYGSRIVPVLASIGRDLDLLRAVDGLDDRARRLVSAERRQPNGGLFEFLVAAAYRRAGARVAFRPEARGIARAHDLDVSLDGREYAVECKRLETSTYGEGERERMRRLWSPTAQATAEAGRSVFGNVDFRVPLADVPETYLRDKVVEWVKSGRPSLLWVDDVSEGVVGDLDMAPLEEFLRTQDVLGAGTRLLELLAGRYVRHANYLQIVRAETGMSPRHVTDCDLAVVLHWRSLSREAIDCKARDVVRKVAEATDQLPPDRHGIVHIGFEAVEGDDVEAARFDKIAASMERFDPKGKPLRHVYCHYLAPESPPDEAWAFDETTQCLRHRRQRRGTARQALSRPSGRNSDPFREPLGRGLTEGRDRP